MGKENKKVYINQPIPLQVNFVANLAAQFQTKPKAQWKVESIYTQSRAYLQSRGLWDGTKQAYKDTTGFEFDENILSPLTEEAAASPKVQEGDEIDEDLLAEEAEEVVNA